VKKNIEIRALDSVQEGDELAEDIKDLNGQLLVSTGKLLDKKTIESLKQRNIEAVTINAFEQLTEEQRQARKDEIIEKINYRFRKPENNSLMEELRNLVIAYRLEGL